MLRTKRCVFFYYNCSQFGVFGWVCSRDFRIFDQASTPFDLKIPKYLQMGILCVYLYLLYWVFDTRK